MAIKHFGIYINQLQTVRYFKNAIATIVNNCTCRKNIYLQTNIKDWQLIIIATSSLFHF